jgi:hypothetical protein
VGTYVLQRKKEKRLNQLWSKGKNIENKNVDDKNEGVGRNVRVCVRVRRVSSFRLLSFSTVLPFDISIVLVFDI